ncbi:MAG: glucokinase [Alphaproteobacteria bacterium]|nr:glucokinase [Alphaproteobacteria bacterium]
MSSGNRPSGNVVPGLRLLADIGGTNARFALARRGRDPYAVQVLGTKDYGGPAQAIAAYLGHKARGRRPESAVIAVGGPVVGDRVKFTNAPWSFSISDLRRASAIDDLFVLNDFEALAWALPALRGTDIRKFGRGLRDPHAPRVVFGPGSGLGVACFVPQGRAPPHTDLVVSSEGGHMSIAAGTPRESALIEALAARFGHVSWERVISGPGLPNIYRALAAIDGVAVPDPASLGAAAVTRRARSGRDPLASETMAIFSGLAGSFAGNLALGYGARGGIYLAGGVIPRLGALFDLRAFRRRFMDKGRYRDWLAAIPTYLVLHPRQTMVGLAHYLDMLEDAALPG